MKIVCVASLILFVVFCSKESFLSCLFECRRSYSYRTWVEACHTGIETLVVQQGPTKFRSMYGHPGWSEVNLSVSFFSHQLVPPAIASSGTAGGLPIHIKWVDRGIKFFFFFFVQPTVWRKKSDDCVGCLKQWSLFAKVVENARMKKKT